ncbi:MAG: hypothetical protein PHV62_03380 [Sulfuricurvum sp.]|nr:hypothetical protein [Sulfuricurvum sp.]
MKNDAPLTKREIKKAARLFTLCMTTQIDDVGSANDDESNMVNKAMELAHEALDKEFPGVSHFVASQAQCVAIIKGMRE